MLIRARWTNQWSSSVFIVIYMYIQMQWSACALQSLKNKKSNIPQNKKSLRVIQGAYCSLFWPPGGKNCLWGGWTQLWCSVSVFLREGVETDRVLCGWYPPWYLGPSFCSSWCKCPEAVAVVFPVILEAVFNCPPQFFCGVVQSGCQTTPVSPQEGCSLWQPGRNWAGFSWTFHIFSRHLRKYNLSCVSSYQQVSGNLETVSLKSWSQFLKKSKSKGSVNIFKPKLPRVTL